MNVIDDLYKIRPGQRVVYYTGGSLEDCPDDILEVVNQLLESGKIRVHLQRTPAEGSLEDRPLQYIAVGR